MTSTHEWEKWEARWRSARTAPAALDAMIERTKRARRSAVFVRVLSTAVAVVALAVVGAALRHAGNPFEAGLGLTVAAGIAVVWLGNARDQREASKNAEAPADEYRAARRALCIRQDRFAKLGWIVVALDLAFLVPWWIGGIAVHGSGFHVAQVLTIWMPVVLMGAFVAWTLRLRRRVQSELRSLVREDTSAAD